MTRNKPKSTICFHHNDTECKGQALLYDLQMSFCHHFLCEDAILVFLVTTPLLGSNTDTQELWLFKTAEGTRDVSD